MRGVNAVTNFPGGLIAGALASTAAACAATDSGTRPDNYDHLAFQIDALNEIKAERADINGRIDEIDHFTNVPVDPDINIREVASHLMDYFPQELDVILRRMEEVDQFFVEKTSEVKRMDSVILTNNTDRFSRIHNDWRRAYVMLSERKQKREQWRQESGVATLFAREEQLYFESKVLESEICSLPCLSARDIQIKVEFASQWFEDPECSAQELVEILKSIRGDIAALPPAPAATVAGGMAGAR